MQRVINFRHGLLLATTTVAREAVVRDEKTNGHRKAHVTRPESGAASHCP
jgi:hypothetical protein